MNASEQPAGAPALINVPVIRPADGETGVLQVYGVDEWEPAAEAVVLHWTRNGQPINSPLAYGESYRVLEHDYGALIGCNIVGENGHGYSRTYRPEAYHVLAPEPEAAPEPLEPAPLDPAAGDLLRSAAAGLAQASAALEALGRTL